jgi:hypothetical protein
MKTKLYLMLAICITLYTSCSKDEGCNGTAVQYANILQSDKDLIPYKGGESLTFLHVNTGDTITFFGESKWTNYSNSSFGGADCVIETRREGRGIGFFNSSKNKLVLNQHILSNGFYVSSFEIDFDDLYIKSSLLDSPYEKILDSISIQKNKYYDIYFYSNDDINPKPQDFGCYYTRKDGIIKLFSKTGDTWELISKH